MSRNPLILVCNDDSVYAKGIKELVDVVKDFGEVVVVAPDKPQSAKSHAVTLENPLYLSETKNFGDVRAYKCSGTPADCVKMAIHVILDRKPDLLVSGINHGSNSSVNIIYSGTLAATLEGCMHGIPSLGLSLLSYDPDADFSAAKFYTKKIIEKTLSNGLNNGNGLNINFPNLPLDKINGIKICRQTKGVWAEEVAQMQHPTRKLDYYWLTGKYINLEPDKTDTDIWALENNYVSVVPIKVDFTEYTLMEKMKTWNF